MKSSDREERKLAFKPFFLDGIAGRVLCVFVGPAAGTRPRGGVLFVPPFAEEMNKARRQVMLQARSLATAGYGVLLVDLYGTGDSEGEFADGRWETWSSDVVAGARWLERDGFEPVAVWGLRFGALLATDIARGLGGRRLVLWQPVVEGRAYMDQFIRMRVAASMLGGGARLTVQDLRRLLEAGETLEVAGYALHPDLVRAADARRLDALAPPAGTVVDWIEIVGGEDTGLGIKSRSVIAAWQQAGVDVRASTVVGQQFWTTGEITIVPALLEHTTSSLANRA